MRQVIPGTYQFVNEPEKLTNLTSATNILFDDSDVIINYTTSPLSGISTDKFVLAIDRSNESQRYTLYAFEDTTAAGGALNVSKGWYWFDDSSMSLSAISAPTVTFTSSCTLNDNMSTDQGNSLFTTAPIQEEIIEYERVLYKGKEEYSMEEFEALTTLDDAVDYNILDYPGNSITNAQMTFALTCKRLFPQDCSFVCSDNGAYIKGHVYKINVNGEAKTWEDITTNTLTNASLEGHTHISEYTLGNGDLYEARFRNGYIYDRENRLNFPSKPGTFALLDDVSGGGASIQVTELPEANASNVNKIVQYIGEGDDDQSYPHRGYFYKCSAVSGSTEAYEWKDWDTQAQNYNRFLTESYTLVDETVGKLAYIATAQKSGNPIINLGQIDTLVGYTGNIELHYSLGGNSYSQILTYEGGMWTAQQTDNFAGFSGIAPITMLGASTGENRFSTLNYVADRSRQETYFNLTTSPLTIDSITKIDTSETISFTAQATFSDFDHLMYSVPTDFAKKMASGEATDDDWNNFSFVCNNTTFVPWDINNLKICELDSQGSAVYTPLKDLIGGGSSTGGQTIQYMDVPVAENSISGKVIQYIGKTFDNSVTSYITFINVGQLSALTTYAGNIEVNWSIGGTSTASTLTKLDGEQAWSHESDLISFILMPTSDAFSQPAMSTELSGYYTLQCVLSEQLNSEILSKNTFFINTIATLVPSRDVIFNTGSLGYSNFDLMMATNAEYSLPQLFISTYYNNTLTVDSLKTYIYVNRNEFKYRLITQNDSSSGLTPGYYSCGNTSKYIQFIDNSTCETPAGLPGYDGYTSWTYVLDDTNKKVILNNPAGNTELTLYLDDEYKSIRMSGSSYEEIFIFTAAYITGHFYRCSPLNHKGGESVQWEPTNTQSKPTFTLIGTTLVIQD